MTTANELSQRRCTPCEGHVEPMEADQVQELAAGVPKWKVVANSRCLRRSWHMKDFPAALEFVNRVGQIAEAEGHHPDIHLTDYRELTVELFTHAVDGLTDNDFILAAKIDELPATIKE